MSDRLIVEPLPPLPEISPGCDLATLLAESLPKGVTGEEVLCVAHKVVSKAEGRIRPLATITPSARARALARKLGKDPRLVQAVLDESRALVRVGPGVLICETNHGFVCANAGVDQSNTEPGTVVLLPCDPDRSARELRRGIARVRGVAPAVVVTDSFGRPFRVGTVDVALGCAGLIPLLDLRGASDRSGRELRATTIAIADAVAAAAELVRGKADGRAAVLVHGLGRFVQRDDGPGAVALLRERAHDLFRSGAESVDHGVSGHLSAPGPGLVIDEMPSADP
ncbi:MAG: coenzyme F420-0:L-glutamate ligase [Thermoleophilum sp.]|nr:coenzyme F420-0:L-glutamate ligase [Thermoleophilum sp.]